MKENNADLIKFNDNYIIDPKTGCWEWIGAVDCHGYARQYIKAIKRNVPAHKWYYEHINGVIDEHLECHHMCRNRGCVNPDHIMIITHKENMGFAKLAGSFDGIKNGNAKRTEIDVAVIKILNRYFCISAPMLSKAMNIPKRSVYSVTRKEVWKHLALPSRKELEREFST